MRRLPIVLADLAEAFDLGNAEATYCLDLETGVVLLVLAETRRILNELLADLDAGGDSPAALTAALADSSLPEWEKEAVLEAYRVEAGYGAASTGVAGRRGDRGWLNPFRCRMRTGRSLGGTWRTAGELALHRYRLQNIALYPISMRRL